MDLQNFRGINFRFSDYISEGYNFYRANFSKIFVASLLVILISLIPFCSYLGIGNFFKFMRKLRAGQNPDASQEIFNFDDFVPYIKLMAVIVLAVLVLEIPIFIFTGLSAGNPEKLQGVMPFYMIYILALLLAIFYVTARGFYIPWLISVKKISNLGEAWRISSVLSKNNIWRIIGFMLITSILAEIGILACGIGFIFTLPFYYVAYYFAMEDGMKQADPQNSSPVSYFK